MGTGDRIPKRGLALATSVALVVAFTVAAVGVPVADATHDHERTTDGFKGYTPGGEIPRPGETYTVELYSTPAFMNEEGPIPPEAEVRVDYVMYYSTTLSHCDADDVYALGIDRGNDLPGTEYDEDMLQSLMRDGDYETGPEDDPGPITTNDDWDHRMVNWLKFPEEDDFAEPLHIHEGGQEDELIVASEDCVEMPDPGWHRTYGFLNGTIVEFHDDRDSITIDGEEYEEGDHFEIWEPSLWYPVCECTESRHVAMELDPPPGQMTRGSEGGIIHPNGTIEAPYAEVNESGWLLYPDAEVPPEDVTSEGIYFDDGFLELHGPIYYSAGHVEADGTIVTPQGERIEPEEDQSREPPTETPTETPTATPTPTEDGTADEEGTPAPTEDADGTDETDETDSTDSTDETDETDGTADDGTADEEGTPASADEPDEENLTPTPGDGPGFGPVAVLIALLAGVALTRRR